MFWTLAFPVVFVLLFGLIFSGGSSPSYTIGWVDLDGTPQSTALRQAFSSVQLFVLKDGSESGSRDAMRRGDVRGVVVVPKGYGAALGAAGQGSRSPAPTGTRPGEVGGGGGQPGQVPPPAAAAVITLYTDPSQQTTSSTLRGIIGQVVGQLNQAMTGAPQLVAVRDSPLQTQDISSVAYIVPSILAMALMQLGLFGALPIVEQREKLILKRLGATPLRRSTLVSSNVLMRLGVGLVQAALILGIGAVVFKVTVLGSLAAVVFLVLLGAATFVALGYVVASFARTEESASAVTSILQFPLMFLSGIFFPFELMPPFLRAIGALIPLTYLGDAMRQVMVNGSAFVPLWVDIAVLTAWLVGCLLVSARYFRWQ
jgi:ABC-2 type transport system permease protein